MSMRYSSLAAAVFACACAATNEQPQILTSECVGTCIELTAGKVTLAQGGVTATDLASSAPSFSFLAGRKDPVACRSDFLVGKGGDVTLVCTNCSDGAGEALNQLQNSVRDMRFKPGEVDRRGAVTASWVPEQSGGTPKQLPIAPAACDPTGARQ